MSLSRRWGVVQHPEILLSMLYWLMWSMIRQLNGTVNTFLTLVIVVIKCYWHMLKSKMDWEIRIERIFPAWISRIKNYPYLQADYCPHFTAFRRSCPSAFIMGLSIRITFIGFRTESYIGRLFSFRWYRDISINFIKRKGSKASTAAIEKRSLGECIQA